MKVRPEALSAKLLKLSPVYIVSGDEPLLVQETSDSILTAAKQQGFTERLTFSPTTAADWQQFLLASQHLSLFSDKQCLVLRLPSLKIGDVGSRALQTYAVNPPADKCLLLITAKIDKKTESLKWYQVLERIAIAVAIWPIPRAELPYWIQKRLLQVGIKTVPEVTQLLAEQVEGNLLAAQQEIEKLSLLFGEAELTLAQLKSSIANHSHFTIFDLVDAIHEASPARIARIIHQLQQSEAEPILVLWALTKELRELALLARAHENNERLDNILSAHKIWPARATVLRQTLKRFTAQQWQQFLLTAGHIDACIKGQRIGNNWQALHHLALAMAGQPLLATVIPRHSQLGSSFAC